MAEGIAGARAERRAHGHIIIDGSDVADTLQCCHCGAHFVSIRGSGTRRGFCLNCMQVTCGSKRCDPCVPFEKRLDEYEKGKRATLLGE
jgi:hypothetical protein